MQTESIATPFGRRMTLGMLATQVTSGSIEAEQSVDKWKIFRAVCEAKPLLNLSDRTLAVLNALLTFYPGNLLCTEQGLVVFPSNAQLSARAHGIAPATLRRHLAALVEAGLLIRKDSPNGKRYMRRNTSGTANVAYGFSVAPLVARSREIHLLAAQIASEREEIKTRKEQLSLCRRDVSSLIQTAMENGIPGDWADILQAFLGLISRSQRKTTLQTLAINLEDMSALRLHVLNLLELHIKPQKSSANESQIERHIQRSESNFNFDLEAAPKEGGRTHRTAVAVPDGLDNIASDDQIGCRKHFEVAKTIRSPIKLAVHNHSPIGPERSPLPKLYPLDMVLRACPAIAAYGPEGRITTWRDLMLAAVVVRSFFGVSPSAFEAACTVMGPENAATTVACLLERAGQITSVGGYLRVLTQRAEEGRFTIGPMIASLLRVSGAQGARRASH
jgi:replication initiation protein RepC